MLGGGAKGTFAPPLEILGGRLPHLPPLFLLPCEDPLWDGVGFGGSSTCCSFNSPPWFMRDLLPPGTTDDIELRMCRDSARSDEDIGLKSIELYMQ